jgi:glycyl-radical enzyme activating protein
MKLPVTRIQRFSTHDGAGVRTVVFLKGCPLRCAWCHNPETQRMGREMMYAAAKCIGCRACEAICPRGAHRFPEGAHVYDRAACALCMACADACPTQALTPAAREMELEEIVAVALRDRAFYGEQGGLTLSGGEPAVQGEGAVELLAMAKAAGMTTAMETCGHFAPELVAPLARVTDEFLWDIKDTDPARHKRYVGADNALILRNLRQLDQYDVRIVLRCILVRGVNLTSAHARQVRALLDSLRHGVRIDLLPYHPFGSQKGEQLGCAGGGETEWIPSKAEIEDFRREAGI